METPLLDTILRFCCRYGLRLSCYQGMFALLASFCLTSKPQSVPSKRISGDRPTGEITWSCSEVMHKWYQSKSPLMSILWLSSLSNVIPVPGKIEVMFFQNIICGGVFQNIVCGGVFQKKYTLYMNIFSLPF